MDRLGRKTEALAHKAALEMYYHEISKNRDTIELMRNSILPERNIVIEDARKRIAQLQEKLNELVDQRDRDQEDE